MPTFYQALWIFVFYAFLGWCVEVVFEALIHGKFMNRGFLNGPVCPIYGFGILAVVVALTPLKSNALVLFVGSVLLTSALEFITGFALEKVFHDKWWDYSKEPCNIKGYVCLRFSLMWGLACMLVMDIVHPLIMKLVAILPHTFGCILLVALYGALFGDLIVTVLATSKLRKRLTNMEQIEKRMRVVSDTVGASLAEQAIKFKDKLVEEKPEIDALRAQLNTLAGGARAVELRLLTAFPRLQGGRHRESIAHIRAHGAGRKPKD